LIAERNFSIVFIMEASSDLSASMEDYLETVLVLEKRNRVARVKEIAEALNVQMPSVTGALKILRHRGLVHYEKNSYIHLTDEGMKVARSIQDRHFALARFLRKGLGLSAEEAQDTACKIEHVISPEVASRLQYLTDFIEGCIATGEMDSREWEKILTGKKAV
jgi:DtxR family transcriptional regulator, Mn-dependent transcriptional regulator